MSPRELETYLHRHIPLSAAMAVSVAEASPERVVLRAPLARNINHRETVFGGSASALAILAGWSLLHVRMRGAGLDARLVIQRNTVTYLRPIEGDFSATAVLANPADWVAFARGFERKRRARIAVSAVLEHDERCAWPTPPLTGGRRDPARVRGKVSSPARTTS